MDRLLYGLTFVCALGCGLVAGVLFAFSSFVMKALTRLPAPQGITAMQSINVAAISPLFMSVLLGTSAACIVLAVCTLVASRRPASLYLLGGCFLFLFGAMFVTTAFNVPRNNALATVASTSANAPEFWAQFVSGWVAWNHVRTIAAFAASAVLMLGFGKLGAK